MIEPIPTIVTYHSTNNTPPWFAYCKPNGEFLGVRMEGNTEEEVIERAKNWWINERAHQKRICGNVELDDDEVGSGSYKPVGTAWGNPPPSDNEGWSSSPRINAGSSDHGMCGKVWLIHHANKQRLRADPDKVQILMEQGWVKAGPKTQFRD